MDQALNLAGGWWHTLGTNLASIDTVTGILIGVAGSVAFSLLSQMWKAAALGTGRSLIAHHYQLKEWAYIDIWRAYKNRDFLEFLRFKNTRHFRWMVIVLVIVAVSVAIQEIRAGDPAYEKSSIENTFLIALAAVFGRLGYWMTRSNGIISVAMRLRFDRAGFMEMYKRGRAKRAARKALLAP